MKNTEIEEIETFEEYQKRISSQVKLKSEKRGRKKNSTKLTEEKQLEILELLKESPSYYNFSDNHVWSAKSIQQLLNSSLNIKLPLSTIRDYLNRWFNIQQTGKSNQIKNLLANNDIAKDIKKDEAVILYVKSLKDGFINIVTRRNENQFIYNGNKNQKNLIRTFKYLISNYKYKSVYLIFDYYFYDEVFFNKLINKNLRIFYIDSSLKSFIFSNDNYSSIKEFQQEKKQIKNKKTINDNLEIEKLDGI